MAKTKILPGMRFGRLVVEMCIGKDKHGNFIWRCRCDCENYCEVRSADLRSSKVKSCGCLHNELLLQRSTTHRMTGTPIYNTWCNIKKRCYDKKSKDYPLYGGRGITMFEEWKENFQAFYDYVSQLPHFGEKGYSIDRIDSNGNYEPNNVRWATVSEQNRNQRSNIKVFYNGVEMCLMEVAEKSGISYYALIQRYHAGDRGERLFRPVKPQRKNIS